MIGVRVVYGWCMCGVLLVWMDVSWAVLVVCIANDIYIHIYIYIYIYWLMVGA